MANYTIDQKGKHCLVTVQGDLVASEIPELQASLKKHLDAGVDEIDFDLGKTFMLDSSGIGLLIAASNSLTRRNGKIRVLNASQDIMQLLQSMRLVGRLNASSINKE